MNYPGSLNPFPYSLLDYESCIQLRDVTLSDHTYIEWESEFATDPQVDVLHVDLPAHFFRQAFKPSQVPS